MSRTRILGVLLAAVVGVAAAVAGVGWSGAAIPAAAGFVPPPHKNHDGSGKTRIGIIGDSVGTTIAFNNAWAPLDKYDYSFDAAGCRRVYATSCKNPPPLTAVATMQQYRGQWGSLLVMLTGYNDMSYSFAPAVDAVMAESARQGIPRVMWLTYRTADVRCVPLSYRSTATTFRDNNLILLQKAREYGGRLVIADWATYSTRYGSNPTYVSPDGVHMYPVAGSFALSKFIADNAGRVLAGEDVTPTCAQAGAASNTPWTFLRFGMGGTGVAEAQRALIARGINLPTGADGYYNDLTVYAVQTFQRSVGLAPKGHIDEQTARALGLIGATWPTVARGTTGAATVRLIETALIGRGIAVRGGVDGVFDIWLQYAVSTFQRHNGIPVSGIVDIATASRLGLTRAPGPGSVWTAVSSGSTGLLVSRAQQALVDHGIAVSSGVTGHFDLPTLYAVQTYQRHHGLLATGVVDVETARSLGLLDPDGNPVARWVDLGLGAAGEPVRTAERCLAAARIRVADGMDGIFKLGDFYAVQTFQRWRSGGLPVTGRIDLASADRLGMLETPVPCAPPVALAAMVTPATTSTTTSTTTSSTTSTTVAVAARPSNPSTSTTTSTTSTTSTSPPTSGASTVPTTSTTLAAETTTTAVEATVPDPASAASVAPDTTGETEAPDTTVVVETEPAEDSTAPATTVPPTTVVDTTAAPVETTAPPAETTAAPTTVATPTEATAA